MPLIRFLIAARYVTLAIVLIVMVALLAFGRRVGYEQSIQSFFAEDDPGMAVYQKAARAFGDDNVVFVVYDDDHLFTKEGIARVGELAADVGPAHVDGVVRVESLDAMPLLWLVDDGLLALEKLPAFARKAALEALKRGLKGFDARGSALTVAAALKNGDDAARNALSDRLVKHPLFLGTLLNDAGTTTALVVRLKKTEKHNVVATVSQIRNAADQFAREHHLTRPAVVGPPVLLADGFAAIEIDGRRLAVVGMLLIGLVTLTATRSLWWALVPIAAGWLVWLATEHILAVLNLKLSLSGGPLVAQIIVLTMPAASHLAIHFRDELRRGATARSAAVHTLRDVSTPVVWTAITGAIGYGALLTSAVVPVQQFGAILGICTLVTALLAMSLSPAAMLPPFALRLRLGKPAAANDDEPKSTFVARCVDQLTHWVDRHPVAIVAVVAALVVPVALGMTKLTYESNYINLFEKSSRVVRDYNFAESRLGGIGLVEIVAPLPSASDAAAIDRLRAVERAVESIRIHSQAKVDYVLTLATVLDPDERLKALAPDVAQRLLQAKIDLIDATPQADLLRGFWNAQSGQTRLIVRLREAQPAPDKAALFAASLASAQKTLGPTCVLTGLSSLMTRTTEAVITTQWTTIVWSVAGILLMLAIALRGPILALLALLPTILAVAMVLGLMGWLGVKLDLATALVASVALGLSVDDTFHCLLQFRRHFVVEKRPFREALFASYSITGPGVLLSSFAVAVGFLALRLSEFMPFQNFGIMVAIATAGSTLGNIILLPACLSLGNRVASRRFRPVPSPTAGVDVHILAPEPSPRVKSAR